MALVTKNDVTQIFAIQAPEVDLPPTFANYPRGWDTARSNNGKPTIKQFNYIQQRTDQNVLWIHQNGAALPYDATMEYAENAVVVKDGELQKKQGASWVSVANKGYNLDYFISGKSYPLHAEIMLTNGDIVKSTVANNVIDPNVDMVGWTPSKLINPVSAYGIVGSGDETSKLQSLLDKLPKNITLDPNKTYNTTGKLYVKSDCVIDGLGATVNCTAPISTPEMIGSDVTELVKGAFTITVDDATKFSIFEDVLIYYNEDNSDTWYNENQTNPEILGITTQKNQVLGIAGNVLTLKYANESKLSDITARKSTVYKIPQNNIVVKNITFNVTANSWTLLRSSGIRFENCYYKKAGGTLNGFSIQMGYNINYLGCEFGEGLALGYNYGSYNCYAQLSTFYAGRDSDGLLLTYAGSNFITSRDNKFLVRNSTAKGANAGLYWGAKCRNCHSYNDIVIGLDYGFRVMFGAQLCSINNMTTKEIGTFSGFISYSSIAINNFTGFDKPIRAISADNLTIKGGFLFSTDKTAIPLLLDLHRNLASDIRSNYHIEGLRCEGKASVTLGVDGFKLLNNNFKVFDHYASAISKNWDIHGNTAGSMRFSFSRDFKISGNTINEANAGSAQAYGLQLRGNAHVTEFEGNTIKNSIVAVNREQDTAQIYLAKGKNNLIAPTQLDFGRTTLPTASPEFDALCGVGFEILASDYYTNGKCWTKTPTGWELGVGAFASATYDPPSLAATGTAGDSATTTVTLTGITLGSGVRASFDKYNSGVEITAQVSAVNTVTVKFKNTSASAVDLASGTLMVKKT